MDLTSLFNEKRIVRCSLCNSNNNNSGQTFSHFVSMYFVGIGTVSTGIGYSEIKWKYYLPSKSIPPSLFISANFIICETCFPVNFSPNDFIMERSSFVLRKNARIFNSSHLFRLQNIISRKKWGIKLTCLVQRVLKLVDKPLKLAL